MAVVSTNIGTAKTIRDFLKNNSSNIKSIQSGSNTLTEVDVIWDGANYYLSYIADGSTSITIAALDDMLPLTIILNE